MKFETKNNLGRVICNTDYDSDNNWIFADWEGFANEEAIKKWGMDFLDLLKNTECPAILNDDSKSTGPWSQAMGWIEEFLIPNVIEAGLKYYAHIVSDNVFAAMSSKELNVKIGGQMEMATFKDIELAKEWLKFKL